MMKKIILIITCLVMAYHTSINAQNVFPMKEHYDKLYFSTYSPANFDYLDCNLTGNQLSWVLSSLLRMYQTTGDKAYLIKFVNHCIHLQKNRRDERDGSIPGDPALWVRSGDCSLNNAEPLYFNSLLISPMAEFINMVIHDPILSNTKLPIQPYITQNIVDMNTLQLMPSYNIGIVDYGHFAWWLGYRVEQTLSYMNNNYWDDTYGVKGHHNDIHSNGDGIYGAGMNMESPYGCALLNMGLSYFNFGYDGDRTLYLSKAQVIARLYKQTLDFTDLCGVNTYDTDDELILLGNNSYAWYTRACSMSIYSCPFYNHQSDISWYKEFIEDVSHGTMDLWFANACYETQFAPCNTCTPYFTNTEMERFRNTFTKNIYFTNSTGAHFHNNVNGTDNPSQADCSPNCPSDLNYGEALNWMPLYKFDSNSPNVYDILMQHTTGLISTPSTQNLTGAQSFLGFSEVIKAQWDKECINLTLYNRDVVYDQDFNVKNKLAVAPEQVDNFHQLNGNSFADPITTNNNFLIESGSKVNMVAGESIELLPGFKAMEGSNFTASINPSACTDGRMHAGNSNTGNGNLSSIIPMDASIKTIGQQVKKETASATLTNAISIYPNPNNGIFKITITKNNTAIGVKELKVFDVLGNVIWQTGATINNVFDVDISDYAQGMYYVHSINEDGEAEVQKLVKQ